MALAVRVQRSLMSANVAVDRGAGYTLRTREGFLR